MDSLQELITGLARRTAYCERHGEVVQAHGYEGATFHDGGYMKTRLFDTTFRDGTRMTFHLVAGLPRVASEWRTKR